MRQRPSSKAPGASTAWLTATFKPPAGRTLRTCMSVVRRLCCSAAPRKLNLFHFATEGKQNSHTHFEMEEPSLPQTDPGMFDHSSLIYTTKPTSLGTGGGLRTPKYCGHTQWVLESNWSYAY